jgi:hypothetical protein
MLTGAAKYADRRRDMLTGAAKYADRRRDMLTGAGQANQVVMRFGFCLAEAIDVSFNMLLWAVENGSLAELTKDRLDNEDRLEQWIAEDVSLLDLDVLIIGRQVRTPSAGRIDLLAIDEQGDIVLLELKRDRTPREVVAQALDYASWVAALLPMQLEQIAQEYLKKPLAKAFQAKFETSLPEVINNDHRIVIVAAELDDSSERIVQYLSARHSLNINVVFFTCFRQGKKEFIGRAWLLDPEEAEQRSEVRRSASWSGYWFFNVGESEHRNWDDCVKYGFLAAGWRPSTDELKRLSLGSKVFAYFRGKGGGYVGLGEVTHEACPAKDFTPEGHRKSLLDLALSADMAHNRNDLNKCECVVGVKWKKTFPREKAKTFTGAFAYRRIVCKLRDQRTLDFLRREFNISD